MRSAAWRLLVLMTLAACAPGASGPIPALDERRALRHLIDSLIAAPETRHARWGVLVVDPERADTLYSHDAGKLFVPASNEKILTSAVALDGLGPDFRFRTLILGGPVRDGALQGDLVVAGRGDPTVSDHVMGDAMLPLRAIADGLAARGITRVLGRIDADTFNAFPDENAGFAWTLDDLEYSYGAVIDELLFNEGFSEIEVRGGATPGDPVRIRTSPARTYPRVRVLARTVARGAGRDSLPRLDAVKDSVTWDVVLTGTIPAGDSVTLEVTHHDPKRAYVAALREALSDRGIAVGDSSIANASASLDTLYVLESPPLSRILPFFLKPSQNQIGEMLFKSVALQKTDTGAARLARRLVGERLRGWGAAPDGFAVFDGSGLTRRDMVTPETLVRVLDAMRRGPYFQVYYDALPVAGVDGTLRTRMRATRAEANVRGKTGTLGGVRSLSGYATTADGRMLLYSILCNNYLIGTDYISRVQDSIAVRLTRLHGERATGGPSASRKGG